MKETINIVHLHILYHNYYTGIDRYLEMYNKGVRAKKENGNIKIHSIYLTNDMKALFPKIETNREGELSAIIPLPQNSKLLFKDAFWKDKYMKVLSEMLQPFFVNISNPIFQYHNLFLSNLAIELKDKFGGKIITHLHCLPWKFNSNNNDELFNKLYQLYEDKDFDTFSKEENSTVQYKSSDKIICLSEVAKDYLIDIHHVEKSRIKIVINGLEPLPALPGRKEKKVPEILYVGKVSKDKGTFELLNALKTVDERGYKFKLKIAGSCPEEAVSNIQAHYQNIEIDYLGQISFDKLKKLYTTCTLGIIPSLHEQCSYVAIEMAMFGLPLIVSEVDALAEMFEHEKTALLTPLVFDPDFGIKADNEKFAENIIRLIDDKKLRSKLSKNIRESYEKRFTLDLMIKNTIDLYKQLI